MGFDLFLIWRRVLNFIPEIIFEIRQGENYLIVQIKYDIFIGFLEYFKNKDNPKKFKQFLYCSLYPILKRIAMLKIEKNTL